MEDEAWPAQLNKMVWTRRHHDPEKQAHKSLVLSIGQVVPHEGTYDVGSFVWGRRSSFFCVFSKLIGCSQYCGSDGNGKF